MTVNVIEKKRNVFAIMNGRAINNHNSLAMIVVKLYLKDMHSTIMVSSNINKKNNQSKLMYQCL